MRPSEDGGSQAVVRSLPETRIPPTHAPCFPVDEHDGVPPAGQIPGRLPVPCRSVTWLLLHETRRQGERD